MTYNWQLADWPDFTYGITGPGDKNLFAFAQRAGRMSGLLDGLAAEMRTQTAIEMMVAEAIKTSAIEGEYISRRDVMSSIRRNLGLTAPEKVHDKRALGAATLMKDQTVRSLCESDERTAIKGRSPDVARGAGWFCGRHERKKIHDDHYSLQGYRYAGFTGTCRAWRSAARRRWTQYAV